jgi:hypothetical protein
MGKHTVRIRLLPVIVAAALVTSISAGNAQAVMCQEPSHPPPHGCT